MLFLEVFFPTGSFSLLLNLLSNDRCFFLEVKTGESGLYSLTLVVDKGFGGLKLLSYVRDWTKPRCVEVDPEKSRVGHYL